MSSRVELVLNSRENRETAARWVAKVSDGSRVEFKPPQRTLEQNDRMWPMLTDICRQHPRFNGAEGRKYTTDQAKVIFLEACGAELDLLPSLDGRRIVPYRQSSSDLSVAEMADLIEFMFAWGAEQSPPIEWSDPKWRAQQQQLAEAS